MYDVPKNPESRLNLRIKPELKAKMERLAEWHGLTLSSYAHSILVKAVRRDEESLPDLFRVESSKESIHGRELSPTTDSGIPLHEPGSTRKKDAA